jgi:glycerol-3-phosphate dehydrogenase (NAD(P)+)
MACITVLGAGMMGTAFTWPLVERGHEVRLVGTHLDSDIVHELKADRAHPKLKLEVPRGVRAFAVEELGDAMTGADAVVLGVSSAGVRWAAKQLTAYLAPNVPVAMISKGLEWDGASLRVLPDVFASALPESVAERVFPVGVAGPCIAGELARRVDTCVVFTGRGRWELDRMTDLARGPYYRIFPSDDVIGVETCAALKNAFAMGVGVAAGLHEKRGGQAGSVAMHNYESAVFTEAVAEMQRVVSILGGGPACAAGLAGAGDLDVTCNGGRTGRFGKWLGLGLSLPDAVARMEGATLECLEILDVMRRALESFDQRGITQPAELPLLRHLCEVAQGKPLEMPFDRFFQER